MGKLIILCVIFVIILAVGLTLCQVAQFGIPLDPSSPKAWGHFGLIHIKSLFHAFTNNPTKNTKIIAGVAIAGSALLIICGILILVFIVRFVLFIPLKIISYAG